MNNQTKSNKRTPVFIKKLWAILNNQQLKTIVYWDKELKAIRVNNQKKMQANVLPKYFRHKKFSSFVRQLNMYDFHKIHLPKNKSAFHHAEFDIQRIQSINEVQRKIYQIQKKEEQKQASEKGQLTPIDQQDQFSKTEIKPLKNKIPRPSLCLSLISDKSTTQNDILQEILDQFQSFQFTKQEVGQKLRQLRNKRRFNKLLFNLKFIQKVYAKLGIEYMDEDRLQNLSIEDDLMMSKKSLDIGSLKLLESGNLFVRDTIKNLFI